MNIGNNMMHSVYSAMQLMYWIFICVSDFPQNRNWPHTRAVRTESSTMRRKELKRSLEHKRSLNHSLNDPIQSCSKPIISAPLAFQTAPKPKKNREHCSYIIVNYLLFVYSVVYDYHTGVR